LFVVLPVVVMADELAAITGLSLVEAASYMEMAGSSLDQAVSLFFDMQGGGSMPDVAMQETSGPAFSPAHVALFGSEIAPVSWSQQGFEFSTDPAQASGLVQHKNGPCGVLAVVNALLISQAGCPQPTCVFDDGALSSVLAKILVRCARGGKVTVANGDGLEASNLPADEAVVTQHLQGNANLFKRPGGVLLLCYSAVLTRGVDEVKTDAAMDGGSTPLVCGPFALCTTELMGLLSVGMARGNVSAYGGDGLKISWRPPSDFGLISRDEIDGRPLADELKTPRCPVFVLHGGDHFTVIWVVGAETDVLECWHWNGLPPSRGMFRVQLRGASLAPPKPAPDVAVQTHWRVTVGELESIVQADPEHKKLRPGAWRTHSYELALVTAEVEAEDQSNPRPDGVPAPIKFDQGEAPTGSWRCASCYQTRFKTMCFGENQSGTTTCKHCGRLQSDVGWTIWRQYSQLPKKIQRRIDRAFGPKILSVVRTRWPEAELAVFDAASGAMVDIGAEQQPARMPAC